MGFGIMKQSVESVLWQDYRASNTGMVVFYASDPVSEIPVREIPEEIESPIIPEPNYETRVYGFFGCIRPKIRQAFFKSKLRYLFFLTKYAGANEEFKDKFMVTGYFRIFKTAEVQKLHLRYIKDSACLETDSCIALRADEARFVSLQDAFIVDEERLKSWGFNAKVNRQLRIVLDAEKTSELLDYLKSRPDQTAAYITETKRLEPHGEEEEEEEEPEEFIEPASAAEETKTEAAEEAQQTETSMEPQIYAEPQQEEQPPEQPEAQPAVPEEETRNENGMEEGDRPSA